MALEFSEVVTDEAQIREVMGTPSQRALRKQLAQLDHHARDFIARSPFLLIASSDADGRMDVSPKGDPPGFVRVLDDNTVAIPDRLGNRRADTFRNLLQRPGIGLLLLVPGKEETLRLNGKARIVRDRWVREPMTMNGKLPDFALVVDVQEVFFHCAKCVIRSKLWDSASWPRLEGLATLAQALVEQGKLQESVEETHALLERDKRERLY
jgi:PPOX class probable FMN-dependent enzyme